MYSRMTNMNRIEQFGTISSKTKLNITSKKNIIKISKFLQGQVRRKGGPDGRRKRCIFTSANTQTPIYKTLYKPFVSLHFAACISLEDSVREKEGCESTEKGKKKRGERKKKIAGAALTVFNHYFSH